ncbi:MAG: zinc-binding dehydrogenase [Acidimicrobiales bacterium]
MHAVTVVQGALEWREVPDPVPGRGEVLVEVHAAGVNAADLLQRMGLYPAPPGSPADIPGLELAGEVRALGPGVTGVAGVEVGARVMAVVGGGAQAEFAVVEASHLLPVPDGIGWDTAGGFAEAFSTAFDALFTQAKLQVGERVLVTGAAGGVGTAGVQLAAAAGAQVTASARHHALHDSLVSLGAAVALAPDEATRRGPFDVVLELVGGDGFSAALGALATGGRMAVIGVGGGGRVELDLLALMTRRARISGSTLRARPSADKAHVARAVTSQVIPLLSSGALSVPVSATYSMHDATDAYEAFASGGKFGKIVLTRH